MNEQLSDEESGEEEEEMPPPSAKEQPRALAISKQVSGSVADPDMTVLRGIPKLQYASLHLKRAKLQAGKNR